MSFYSCNEGDKMTLSREEQETIITFDETTADTVIFTYNRTWQQHLEKRLGLKPTMNNGFGGKEYQIPKSRIKPPRAPKKLSTAQRQKLATRLRKARHQKSPNSSKSRTVLQDFKDEKVSEGKTSDRKRKGVK